MKKNFFIIICLLVIIVSTTACVNKNEANNKDNTSKTYYIDAEDSLTFSNIEELIGYADYVFIGKVDEVINGDYDKEKDLMPYTKYKMTIEHNYKGNLKENIVISKNGGYDKDGDLHLLKNNDGVEKMLDKDKKYLIFANGQHDGELLVISTGGTYEIDDDIKSYSSNITAYKYNKSNKITINLEESVLKQKEYKRDRFKSKYEK